MNQLNSLILEGNVVTEPIVSEPVAGRKVAKFPISVSRWYKKNDVEVEELSFFDIECYGLLVEIAETNCKKGRCIRLVGRLKQDRWTDSEGNSHSRVYVVPEHFEFKPIIKKEKKND